MLKLTSIALGLLAAISIVPSAQASPFIDRNRESVTNTVHRPVLIQHSQNLNRHESHNRQRVVVVRHRNSAGRERFARHRWERNQDRYQSRHHYRHS
jgi:hypothetical protein